MKKLLAGLLTAFLMTGGLVAVASAPASAACPPSGYGDRCIRTETRQNGDFNLRVGESFRMVVKVRTLNGNLVPKGRFVMKLSRTSNGKVLQVIKKKVGPKGMAQFRVDGLKSGEYRNIVFFRPKAGSDFKSSRTDNRRLQVKPTR